MLRSKARMKAGTVNHSDQSNQMPNPVKVSSAGVVSEGSVMPHRYPHRPIRVKGFLEKFGVVTDTLAS